MWFLVKMFKLLSLELNVNWMLNKWLELGQNVNHSIIILFTEKQTLLPGLWVNNALIWYIVIVLYHTQCNMVVVQ